MNRALFYTRKIIAAYGYRRALRFYALALIYGKSFDRWFDFIEKTLPQNISDELKTILAMKVAFRLVNPQWNVPQRVDALICHYTTLGSRFSPAFMADFMTQAGGVQIAEMTGQSGNKYAFKLQNEVTKEGALKINLIDIEANAHIAMLAALICPAQDGRPIFMVGMLRGPGPRLLNGKQRVADATRDLKGLRPKQAVVHAASAFSDWFKIAEIVAPGTEKQVAIKNWFKGQKIYADYDSFWQEFTKETGADGCYHLAVPLPRRALADVQQKRRKDWLLRYEKIDAASAEIKSTLDGFSIK